MSPSAVVNGRGTRPAPGHVVPRQHPGRQRGRGGGPPQGPEVDRRGRPDQHEVAEPLALEHLVQPHERDVTERRPGTRGHPSGIPQPGLVGDVGEQQAARRQRATHLDEPLDRGELRRHPPPGIRVDDHDVGARVAQPRHPGHPVERPHPDAVTARERQLAPHGLGERGVGLEHHLGRPGTGGLHPAGEGESRAPHVGDAQRAVRREGVDAQGEVLHVLEVEALAGRRGRPPTAAGRRARR